MKIIIKESAKNRLFLESIKMEKARRQVAGQFRRRLQDALFNKGDYDFDGSKITIYADKSTNGGMVEDELSFEQEKTPEYTYELGKNYVDHNGEAIPLHYTQKSVENIINKSGINQPQNDAQAKIKALQDLIKKKRESGELKQDDPNSFENLITKPSNGGGDFSSIFDSFVRNIVNKKQNGLNEGKTTQEEANIKIQQLKTAKRNALLRRYISKITVEDFSDEEEYQEFLDILGGWYDDMYDESKDKFLRDIDYVGEVVKEYMNMDYEKYDNLSFKDIACHFAKEYVNGQYYEEKVPDNWICYLVNGESDGLEDNEIEEIDEWVDSLNKNLSIPIYSQCVTLDEVSPSFDYNYGTDCYNFIFF